MVIKVRDRHGRGQHGPSGRRPALGSVIPSNAMLWEALSRHASQRRFRPLSVGEQDAPSSARAASVERAMHTMRAVRRRRPMHHVCVRAKIHFLTHATDFRARRHIVHRVDARPLRPEAVPVRAAARGIEEHPVPHGAIESCVSARNPQAPSNRTHNTANGRVNACTQRNQCASTAHIPVEIARRLRFFIQT